MPRNRKVPNTDPSITPVIFRKFRKDSEVIALFPYIVGTNDERTCQSFLHVGQHGAADVNIMMHYTVPASEAEAHGLIVELTSAPYHYPPLRILRRFPVDSAAVRRSQVSA